MGKIWAISSGSGGVGKTTLALALAVGAAQKGKQVVLLDACGLSRSCDLLLGVESIMSIDLSDVLTQQMDIKSALYPVAQCENLKLANVSLYSDVPLEEMSGVILAIQSMCDILVIDLPAGKSLAQEGIMNSEDEWLLVLRPDDAAIRSCERMMQGARGTGINTSLVLSRVRKERIKRGQQYAADAVSMLLDAPVMGMLPEDEMFIPTTAQGKKLQEWQRIAKSAPVREVLGKLLNI